ncbi:hypothetical protein BKA65DRAFT_138632 [Rhexocercosporidium sp. MPI-PUGE-AT-0058]|nr:hypothetical protein BKA65DRAFT_138632 [Rhexocercosporidium sp. MPI-PUGE-AT-0058]
MASLPHGYGLLAVSLAIKELAHGGCIKSLWISSGGDKVQQFLLWIPPNMLLGSPPPLLAPSYHASKVDLARKSHGFLITWQTKRELNALQDSEWRGGQKGGLWCKVTASIPIYRDQYYHGSDYSRMMDCSREDVRQSWTSITTDATSSTHHITHSLSSWERHRSVVAIISVSISILCFLVYPSIPLTPSEPSTLKSSSIHHLQLSVHPQPDPTQPILLNSQPQKSPAKSPPSRHIMKKEQRTRAFPFPPASHDNRNKKEKEKRSAIPQTAMPYKIGAATRKR